jgi:hypothetical protein
MREAKDAYWDELGLAWTAMNPAPQSLAPRLKWRLRRQTMFMAIALSAGLPLSLAGAALGAWTIWFGASAGWWNFITRGIAILMISLISGFAAWSFQSALRDKTQSLGAMIELSLLRTQRWLRAIRLGYSVCGIAVIFGMAGYEIRVHFYRPPAVAPVWPAMILIALGFVLYLLQRRIEDQAAKYRYLKQTLLDEPG